VFKRVVDPSFFWGDLTNLNRSVLLLPGPLPLFLRDLLFSSCLDHCSLNTFPLTSSLFCDGGLWSSRISLIIVFGPPFSSYGRGPAFPLVAPSFPPIFRRPIFPSPFKPWIFAVSWFILYLFSFCLFRRTHLKTDAPLVPSYSISPKCCLPPSTCYSLPL